MEEQTNVEVRKRALAELVLRLERVCDMQPEKMFLLTGFILSQADFETLRPLLGPDTPSVGARGRYDRVPVYMESDPQDLDDTEIAACDGVVYSFVKMDVVN